MSACRRVSPGYPERGVVLTMLVGLLASTGLRSGEALRLDRADVDLAGGVLHIRKTKFRKDRCVQVHTTTLAALRQYARHRDAAFPASKDTAFFLSSRGNRLSAAGLYAAFDAACALAGLDGDKGLRPHDLRHNSGTRIIPATDVQRMYFLENREVVGTINRKGTITASTQRACVGSLAAHLDKFAEFLVGEGYVSETIKAKYALVADLSHWLKQRGVPLAKLDETRLKQFHAHRRGSRRRGDVSTGHQLLELLRRLGVVPALPQRVDQTALGQLTRD